jgi:hypothetical protein
MRLILSLIAALVRLHPARDRRATWEPARMLKQTTHPYRTSATVCSRLAAIPQTTLPECTSPRDSTPRYPLNNPRPSPPLLPTAVVAAGTTVRSCLPVPTLCPTPTPTDPAPS